MTDNRRLHIVFTRVDCGDLIGGWVGLIRCVFFSSVRFEASRMRW
jgi:hypothetical protein